MPSGRVAKTFTEKLDIFEKNTIPEPNSGCLIWLGDLRGKYGYAAGSGLGTVHRWVATELKGDTIPPGMQSCHYCGNAWCVEPGHLYVGTPKQNMADAKRHGTFQIHLDSLSKRWKGLSPEERQLHLDRMNEAVRRKWDSQSREQRSHRMRGMHQNIKFWEDSLSPEQLAEHRRSQGNGPKKFQADFKERDPEGYKLWTRDRALKSAAKRIANRKARALSDQTKVPDLE